MREFKPSYPRNYCPSGRLILVFSKLLAFEYITYNCSTIIYGETDIGVIIYITNICRTSRTI